MDFISSIKGKAIHSPHGVPVSTIFYAHDPTTRDYKDASKIKAVDLHPTQPWLLSADESGNVLIWDYEAESVVHTFSPEATKEAQKHALETLEAHASFAASQGVQAPEFPSAGLGVGTGVDAGSAAGGAMESFVSTVIAGARKRPISERVPEDARSGKAGGIRAVRFADEHVLALTCGLGNNSIWSSVPASKKPGAGVLTHGCVGSAEVDPSGTLLATPASVPLTMAGSVDEALAGISPLNDPSTASWGSLAPVLSSSGGGGGPFTSAAANANPARLSPKPCPQWFLVLCEQRVFAVDYATSAVVDIPHSALLIEATGANILQRAQTKGKPGVQAAAVVSPGVIAFGCDDGVIRIWSADANATIQTIRPVLTGASNASFAGKPVTQLFVFSPPSSSSSTAIGGGSSQRSLLMSASSDGLVNVYELQMGLGAALGIGGKPVIDAGGKGGGSFASFKLGGSSGGGSELIDMSFCPVTMTAVALMADKSVFTWDASVPILSAATGPIAASKGSAAPVPSAASSFFALSKLVTSSSASETGVGSKMLSAVALGAHPAFSPTAILAASKGPHLELAVVGSTASGAAAAGASGAASGGAAGAASFATTTTNVNVSSDTGVICYDLRTSRPGLPSKCKIYALTRHPIRPDLVACGTNIGVFVVLLSPAPAVASLAVTHPHWRIKPSLAQFGITSSSIGGGSAGASTGASSSSAGSSGSCSLLPYSTISTASGTWPVEGNVVVHVNANGSLVASEVQVATQASPEDLKTVNALALASFAASAASAASGAAASGSAKSSAAGGPGGVAASGKGGVPALSSPKSRSSALPSSSFPTLDEQALRSGIAVRVRDHVLVPGFAPAIQAPHNLAPLAALLKQQPGGQFLPVGGRGVRIRVSGSGHFVSAVWPEAKCYSIYRIAFGCNVRGSNGLPLLQSRGEGEDDDEDAVDPAKMWFAELIETGSGVDVAWCGPTVNTFVDVLPDNVPSLPKRDDLDVDNADSKTLLAAAMDVVNAMIEKAKAAQQQSQQQQLGLGLTFNTHAHVDRFAIIEPGVPTAVKKVYGGGMPIGASAAAAAGGGKGGKGSSSSSSSSSSSGAPSAPHFPNSLTVKQLPIPASSDDPAPKAVTLLTQAPLQQEPLAVWGGGPVLAVALASDTGTVSSNLYTSLASASLQFFSWEITTPARTPEDLAQAIVNVATGKDSGAGNASSSAYAAAAMGLQSITAKAKQQATKPSLPIVSSGFATPSPSVAGVANGCGVVWEQEGFTASGAGATLAGGAGEDDHRCLRFAIIAPFFVHVFAVITTPGGEQNSGGSAGFSGSFRSIVELCRVQASAQSAAWVGGALQLVEVGGKTLQAIIPPIADLSSAAAATASLQRNGTRASPLQVDLVSPIQPPALDPSLLLQAIPNTKRSPFNGMLAGTSPLFVARGHAIAASWLGLYSSSGVAGLGSAGGSSTSNAALGACFAAIPLLHPGLRAVTAASAFLAPLHSLSTMPTQTAAMAVNGYLEAASHASSWGALLPAGAQAALGGLTGSLLGNVPAALMLPSLPASIGIGLALRTRADAFSTALTAAEEAAKYKKGKGSSSVGGVEGKHKKLQPPTLLPLADGLVATNYLCSLVTESLSDEELKALCTPDAFASFSDPMSVELSSGSVGLWPQVAAYLSLASAVFPHMADDIRDAIGILSERLRLLGHFNEAMVVGAVLPPPSSSPSSSSSSSSPPLLEPGLTSVDLVVAALKHAVAVSRADADDEERGVAEARAFALAAGL